MCFRTDITSIQGHGTGTYKEININRIRVRVVQKVSVSNYAKIRYGCRKDMSVEVNINKKRHNHQQFKEI